MGRTHSYRNIDANDATYSSFTVSTYMYFNSEYGQTNIVYWTGYINIEYEGTSLPVHLISLLGTNVTPDLKGPVNDDQWNLVAFKYDMANAVLYTNLNNPVTVAHAAPTRVRYQYPYLTLGDTSSSKIDHAMRYFAFFNSALTDSQIKQLNYEPMGIKSERHKLDIYFKLYALNYRKNVILKNDFYMQNVYGYTPSSTYYLYEYQSTIPALDADIQIPETVMTKAIKMEAKLVFKVPRTKARHGLLNYAWDMWVHVKTRPTHTTDLNYYFFMVYKNQANTITHSQFQLKEDVSANNCFFIAMHQVRNTTFLQTTQTCASLVGNWYHFSFAYQGVTNKQYFLQQDSYIMQNTSPNPVRESFYEIQLGHIANHATQSGTYLLREFRVWNCYRTPSEAVKTRHNQLHTIDHPSLITYLTLSDESSDGTIQTNYGYINGFEDKNYVQLTGFTFETTTPALVLCTAKQSYHRDTGQCSDTNQYSYGFQYKQDGPQSVLQWVINSGVSYVVDHWVYISGNPLNSQIFPSSVSFIGWVTDASSNLVCHCGENPTGGYSMIPFINRWVHLAIAGIGKQSAYLYHNGHSCRRNSSHTSIATPGSITLYLASQNFPTNNQFLIIKQVRRWNSMSYIEQALALRNSSIMDPYDIPYLMEYYPMDAYLPNNDQFREGKTDPTTNYLQVNWGANLVQTIFAHNSFGNYPHRICHSGQFLGPAPQFDTCFTPRPVRRYHYNLDVGKPTGIPVPLVGVVDTSNRDNTQFTMAFWFCVDHPEEAGTSFTELIGTEINSDIRVYLQDIQTAGGILHFTAQGHTSQHAIQLNQRVWYQGIFKLYGSGTIHKAIIMTPKNTIINQLIARPSPATGFNKEILKIYAGATTYKNYATYFVHQRIRNFFYIDSTPIEQHVRVLMMSESHIYEAAKNSHMYFSSFSYTRGNQIEDIRDQVLDKFDHTYSDWVLDQTFPYQVCDVRFGGSNMYGTCGRFNNFYIGGAEHYTEQLEDSNSPYHNIFQDGTNNYPDFQSMTQQVWIQIAQTQAYNFNVLMFGCGSLRPGSYDANSFFWGLALYFDYIYAVKYNHILKLYITKNSVVHLKNFGVGVSYSSYNQWTHYSLIRHNITHYDLYINGHKFAGTNSGAFPTGKFHHSYQFGTTLNQKATDNTNNFAVIGRYRDYAIYLGAKIMGSEQYKSGYGFLDTECLYFSPMNHLTSVPYMYINQDITG